jgi:pyrimidine-nucleoside phosphorylase
MIPPYRVLAAKRDGRSLAPDEIAALVTGAVDGSWTDAQLAAFLMAAVLRGLDAEETLTLTRGMLESGERWRLSDEVPCLGDKHSTGGVGDKISLPLAPVLAACGIPIVMLTGRGLGHTGGTADKLEAIPGMDQALSRERALALLRTTGMALGLATGSIAPADRKLYALRDATATIESLPLVVASILSKKLATGAAAVVFDVKTGSGAFFQDPALARELARQLVATSRGLGTAASGFLTDMSQPLGRWVGHAAEVLETLEILEGSGPADVRELTLVLAEEVAAAVGQPRSRPELEAVIGSGKAHELFLRWTVAQGGELGWERRLAASLAPVETIAAAPRGGWLAGIDTRELGLLLIEAGGGRLRPGAAIDHGVSLRMAVRLGDRLEPGQELLRLLARAPAPELAARLAACFRLAEEPVAPPPLVCERIDGARIAGPADP